MPNDHHQPPQQGPLQQRFEHLLGEQAEGPVAVDPVTQSLFGLAARAAKGRATVLVTGPSGVGKEVLARFVHDKSERHARPFLAINCAALPETMLEALLFGHERGAFPGAQNAAEGLFRAADQGTLFLDELGELPLALQAKLRRAVELGEILPLGASAPVKVDVRLVAATNRNLAAEVEAGRFRADLYWRLSVFPVHLPPLAARPGDILPLAALQLRRHGVRHCPEEAALQQLLRHPWPGNIRELGNALERAVILAGNVPIRANHLGLETQPTPASLADELRRHEAEAMASVLAATAGHRREAARRLGISERTLRYKLAAIAGRPRQNAASQFRLATA